MQTPTIRKPEWTILKLLGWTTAYFQSKSIDSPRADAEILLAHALNVKRIDLYLQHDQPIFGRELSRYRSMITRRVAREPVAYIVGAKEFWSMEFSVSSHVLIPRPETEILVQEALSLLGEPAGSSEAFAPSLVLEIGTGSGAVILALAKERPGHRFFASDLSLAAIKIAKRNAAEHHLHHRVSFFNGNLLDPLEMSAPPCHMILANPPYIRTEDIDRLQPEIYKFEPRMALDGHRDGLFFLQRIVGQAHRYLRIGGYLLLEIGYDQKPKIEKIILDAGHYEKISFTKDYSGHDRVVSMRKTC